MSLILLLVYDGRYYNSALNLQSFEISNYEHDYLLLIFKSPWSLKETCLGSLLYYKKILLLSVFQFKYIFSYFRSLYIVSMMEMVKKKF